ncbi:MAG: hypothetical protein IJK42_06970 [Prevotella sp.]|nr:hypothetical protein [Prevotella sp.]
MGNLFEEILKGVLGGNGSIFGNADSQADANQQEETTTMGSDANIPKAGSSNDPFDIGDELDDIATGRNQGTKTYTEEETSIPSMGGIDIGDILKKIIVGGSATPSTKEQEEEQATTTQTIDIGDILGKLGLGLGSSGSGGMGSILQVIIQVIKMMKGSAAGQRAGFIEQQLGEYFTPDQVSQLMAAAEDDGKEQEPE